MRRLTRQLGVRTDYPEQDYPNSWVLYGIYSTDVGENLLFEGGTVLSKLHFPATWRFSEDLDFTVDGTDYFETGCLLNDACTLAGVPLSHGAIYRFEGQITTFGDDSDGPCYRCIFPEAPPEGLVPNCATAGVLGVLPGTVGCIQATEAVKAILETGEGLEGRRIFYGALEMPSIRSTSLRNPIARSVGIRR